MSNHRPTVAADDQTPIIECRGLSKNYGSTRALSNIDLTLNAGAPIALIGPNGAGKTTFLSLLCGFIRPSQGSVTVLGQATGSSAAHNTIAALPQDAWLDPAFSVARQLRHYAQLRGMSRKHAAHEANRVLQLVKLAARANSKPNTLSHGMRKRVMIAQALIGQPKLILLDEPTAGIDPPNVKIIRDLIAEQAHNATFVVSSHNLDELEKICSTVVHLSDGQLRGVGNVGADAAEGYLTISIRSTAPEGINAAEVIASLPGISQLRQKSHTEFAIEYNPQVQPNLDITLLQRLTENGIGYRRLIKGRTLEEQLFSDH